MCMKEDEDKRFFSILGHLIDKWCEKFYMYRNVSCNKLRWLLAYTCFEFFGRERFIGLGLSSKALNRFMKSIAPTFFSFYFGKLSLAAVRLIDERSFLEIMELSPSINNVD